MEDLRPDIVVGLGDIPYGLTLSNKRIEKAVDRTIDWLAEHGRRRKAARHQSNGATAGNGVPKLLAPLLPVSCKRQRFLAESISSGEIAETVDGLAIYSLDTLEDIPAPLDHLPRLGFTTPKTVHEVLVNVSRGVDILTIPLIGAATDAGIALDFTFPAPSSITAAEPLSLGIDLWSTSHAIDLSPLVKGCTCYACTTHHRAYLQHLLAAKEMLAWVLLQVHNHHIFDLFFAGIRQSIAAGTFEQQMERFERVYESQLPETGGLGPR